MIFPSAKIKLDSNKEFFIDTGSSIMKESVPFWAYFEHMPCPGNKAHGPDISYCRLGVEIEKLIYFFCDIKSIDKCILTIYQEENIEIHINGDAQTIFSSALWFILLYSDCSVFKHSQWARRNYLINTTDLDKIFYTLFSIFIVEESIISPNSMLYIEKFQDQLKMQHNVLNNLLERLISGADLHSDSVSNGFVMLTAIISLIGIKFDKLYIGLRERIKGNSRLAN
jgi:hypothetical protein